MDTPTNKTQLLDWIAATRAELDAVIAPLSAAQMAVPGAEAALSVKDLLAHVSWWERRTLRALDYAARGEAPPKLAAEGEGEAGIDRVNAETFAVNRDRTLAEVRAEYVQSGRDLLSALAGYSEADLFNEDGLTRFLGFPALYLIAGDTYMHYPDHVASIRGWLEADRTDDISSTGVRVVMDDFARTERNKVKRLPQRAQYDKATIYGIVDEAPICHVGFTQEDQPVVIAMLHARIGDTLYFHGAPASRLLKLIGAGQPMCVAFTVLDGLVLARSVSHHSVNYRSAVVFGTGELVASDEEKLTALEALTEHITPGRWADARQPNRNELDATSVIALRIESASAKVRTGPPADDEADYALPVWAGIVPLQLQALSPIDDPKLGAGIAVPGYVMRYDHRAGEDAA